MDVKGITWAANIYHKFEAMCLEVEEIMYQDTVKYMESQVQTVGASVKKFYSDVVEDLLPPSSLDPGKVTNSEFVFEQFNDFEKKPKPIIKKEPLKVDIGQLRKRAMAPGTMEKNHVAVNSTPGTHCVDNSSPSPILNSMETGGLSKQLSPRKFNNGPVLKGSTEPAGASLTSEKADCQSTEVLKRNVEASGQETPSACLASSQSAQDNLSGESTDEIETRNDPDSSRRCLPSNTSLLESELAQNSAREKNLSSSEGFPAVPRDISWDNNSTVSFGASSEHEDFYSSVYEEICFSNSERGTVHCSDKVKLEESCILINGEELQFVATDAAPGKSRPYKKKIRDALSSRKRASRAQEYKQLAAHFANNAKSNDELAPSSGATLSSTKSSGSSRAHDLGEPEWELL